MVAEHGAGQQCRAAALTLKLGEINKPISVIDQCQLGGTITQGAAAAVPKGVACHASRALGASRLDSSSFVTCYCLLSLLASYFVCQYLTRGASAEEIGRNPIKIFSYLIGNLKFASIFVAERNGSVFHERTQNQAA